MTKNIKCEIYCQKGKSIDMHFPLNLDEIEKDGIKLKLTEKSIKDCKLGNISIDIKNTSNTENFNLRMERPVRVYLPMECPEKITAMYLYNEWWTRPAFVDCFKDIPDRTQVIFMKYSDRYVCFVPMVGVNFKTYVTGGTEKELCLEMTSGVGGQRSIEEPLYLIAQAPSIYEAVHKAFLFLADYKGIRLKEERRMPEMFKYLGWCSWDAFYRDVNEDGILKKADELFQKNVPVKWIVIDDGWMTMRDDFLCDFSPDAVKFPNGFANMTTELEQKNDIRWIGVWHALGGFWGGIDPESPLATKQAEHLYKTASGKLLPSPINGDKFFRAWYEQLNRDGIKFVKVDGQSSTACYFENTLPLAQAATGMNEALESAVSRMDGAVINCMGMAMENILARPVTAISRNSDDFMPNKADGFAEHILQNAFNSLYHDELYCCDWDMFWTKHEDATKHSLLRAVSGGPVYISDKPDDTNPEILKPLAYNNGEILMMARSAKPTQDCVFSNPLTNGVLKLQNVASYADKKAGGIAVFNLTDTEQTFSFSPSDIAEIDNAESYFVYDYFNKKAFSFGKNEKYVGNIKNNGYQWFIIIPSGQKCSCLGLLNKYVGFTAVECIYENEDTMTAVIKKSGKVGWISNKTPSSITINGQDFTNKYEKNGNIYTIDFPETNSNMLLLINFNNMK